MSDEERPLTNVEALHSAIRVRKERFQNNFTFSDFSHASLDCYITSRMPEPDLGDCQDYTGEELRPATSDSKGLQIIEYEKLPTTDSLIQTIRSAKTELKRLREYRARELREEFKRILAMHPKQVTYFWRSKAKEFRPILYRSIPDGMKQVYVKVALKPRTRIVWKVVGFRNGKPVRATRPQVFTPHVWRPRIIPKHKKIVVRQPGLYRSKKIESRTVMTYDWPVVRSEFAAYKHKYDLNYNAAREEQILLLTEAYKKIATKPNLLQAYTTLGATDLYQVGQTKDPNTMPGSRLRIGITTLAPRRTRASARLGGAFMEDFLTEEAMAEYTRSLEMEHEMGNDEGEYITPRRSQGQISMRTTEDVEQTYTLDSDERLAYSSVASLTRGGDYAFQWFRSLLELKDFKSTLMRPNDPMNQTVIDFFRSFFMHEIMTRMAEHDVGIPAYKRLLRAAQEAIDKKFGKHVFHVVPDKHIGIALKGWTLWKYICRCYLCWKFAVEPTMADIETLQSNTKEWIFGLRRTLTTLLDHMQEPGNIYHARAKFGANNRALTLGVYTTLKSTERDDVTLDVVQSVELPMHVLLRPGETCTVIEGDPSIAEMDPTGEIHGYRHYYSTPEEGSEIVVTSETKQEPQHTYFSFPSEEGVRYYDPFDADYDWWEMSVHTGNVLVHPVSDDVARPDEGLMPSIHLPVYAYSLHQGVAFAAYLMKDVINLSRELRTLCEKLKGHLDADWYSMVIDSFNHLDTVFVAWELTPLSFVYDWFTNSHSIVMELNNLIRREIGDGVPNPLYGIWETRRAELLTGTVRCEPRVVAIRGYVSDWHKVRLEWSKKGHIGFACAAKTLRLRYTYKFQVTDDKVHLTRSGLYRVRRGEHLGYSAIQHYLPQVKVKLNGGKLTTLAALLSSFAGR